MPAVTVIDAAHLDNVVIVSVSARTFGWRHGDNGFVVSVDGVGRVPEYLDGGGGPNVRFRVPGEPFSPEADVKLFYRPKHPIHSDDPADRMERFDGLKVKPG